MAERADAARVGTDAHAGERMWGCDAGPRQYGQTGGRVFMINQEGVILQFTNHDAEYSGRERGPRFDASFSSPGDMSSRMAVNGTSSQDGNFWTRIQ